MVVQRGVRTKVAAQIVLVKRAVQVLAGGGGQDLHWGARRAVEVRRLVRNVNLKLLNTFDWSWHHASGDATARGSGRGRGKAGRVSIHGAVHVAAVVPAVELVGILVADGSRHRPVRGRCRLQRHQTGNVTAQVGQPLQDLRPDSGAHRSVQRLQVRARGLNHDRFCDRTYLQFGIDRKLLADAYSLFRKLCERKAYRINFNDRPPGNDIYQNITAHVIGGRALRSAGGVVNQ